MELCSCPCIDMERFFQASKRQVPPFSQASNALAQFAHLPSTIIAPERYKVQIINYQAMAAVGARNMEEFMHYLLVGVAGAKALGSEKRWQEAIANWRAARKRWPGEDKIPKLADALMEL